MPMNSKIIREEGEENGKGIIKAFLKNLKYEQKQEHHQVTLTLFFFFFSYNRGKESGIEGIESGNRQFYGFSIKQVQRTALI